MDIILSHIALALIMFWVVNFIGKHTPSRLGYYQLTTFRETEEAPAFNFLLRVAIPTVFILLVSTLFYSLELDDFVVNIYKVSIYYVLFRLAFNVAINRTRLINWTNHIIYSLGIVGLNYLVYVKIIATKSNILPDFQNIANELWVILLIFIYNIINNISLSSDGIERRKNKFIRHQFGSINRRFGQIIARIIPDLRLRQIALAIIIYESFNRPKVFRLIEYVNHFIFRRPHTLGIMQVRTEKFIGDRESVRLGSIKLLADFQALKGTLAETNASLESYMENSYQQQLIEMFNPDLIYSYEVTTIADQLNAEYFGNLPTNLFTVVSEDIIE